MIQMKNICKEFAGRQLFSDISWRIGKQDRIGLVGENGSGKSTLLKIIGGVEEPSSGTVWKSKGCSVGYLPQEFFAVQGKTLFTEVMSALDELQDMEREMREINDTLGSCGDDDSHHMLLERLGELQEEFRSKGGYSREATVGNVLSGLGFVPSDWERECGTFSGGWQMRIALAKLLLQRPNVLLLDEPTNHLDLDARNWLEGYLKIYPFSVILVSHDRFFMDQVCSRIAEVWNGTVTDYPCNFSRYLQERDERVSRLREAKQRQDEEIAKIEEFISRFRSKADKASLVQSRMKQLDRIERISVPPERKRIRFSFPEPPRSGRVVLELKDVTKVYDDLVVLDAVSLTVERGERISLVGHNGAGKSTLMRVLAGGSILTGERVVGTNVLLDYFAQDQASSMDGTRTVYEEMLAAAPYDRVPCLRDMLGAFLFSGDDIHKRVEVLSGGEKSRLALARMLLKPSNLLLLDEPTNHLDLFSKDVLLEALQSYAGTVVFVSHDRYFINALATRTIEVGDGKIRSFPGNYEEYLEKSGAQVSGLPGVPSRTVTMNASSVKEPVCSIKQERIFSREEAKRQQREERSRQKKLEDLESRIVEVEERLASLEKDMERPDYFRDASRAREGARKHAEMADLIASLYDEWEALHAEAVQ
jgi:ATP-binding cassette, subfamily F, member 3